jgi:regulator of cell morphogenesis and NO signaling
MNEIKPETQRDQDKNATITSIVASNHRAAQVFQKYGIEFCCGGNVAFNIACESRGLDPAIIELELQETCSRPYIPVAVQIESWDIDFLTAYIVNVHHQPLRQSLAAVLTFLERFVAGHEKKFPYLPELMLAFQELSAEVLIQFVHEEEIIFPYIKQIAHALNDRESYAGLLVRTLRKPVENIIRYEHKAVKRILERMRTLTDNYLIPSNACPNHRVTFLTLAEIDSDLMQQFHLEADILFPKALAIETELLALK